MHPMHQISIFMDFQNFIDFLRFLKRLIHTFNMHKNSWNKDIPRLLLQISNNRQFVIFYILWILLMFFGIFEQTINFFMCLLDVWFYFYLFLVLLCIKTFHKMWQCEKIFKFYGNWIELSLIIDVFLKILEMLNSLN